MAVDHARLSQTLAVIGCGAVVEELYLPALDSLSAKGWTLLLVDAHLPRAQGLAARFPLADALGDAKDVFGKASHAIVSTPPPSHAVLCRNLLEAGIHVLCEKPFVVNPHEGHDLVALAAHRRLALHVNQTRRWFPAALAAKQFIAGGGLGEIASVKMREGIRFQWPAKTGFHMQAGMARNGILSDLGAHTFDLVGWILGQPLQAVAVQHDGYAGSETTARVSFASGATRGVAVMTWLVNVPPLIEFTGAKGTLTIDQDCNRAIVRTGGSTRDLAGAKRYTSYQSIVADVIGAFVAGSMEPSVATGSSVMSSIEFLDRAYSLGKAELPFATKVGVAP